MRLAYALALLTAASAGGLAGCAATGGAAECDPLRPAGTGCAPSAAVAVRASALQAQADSVLALPPASVTTAGLVLVQRAHAERLASVEVRARRGDRTSSGILVYLVVGVALSLSAYAALVNGQP